MLSNMDSNAGVCEGEQVETVPVAQFSTPHSNPGDGYRETPGKTGGAPQPAGDVRQQTKRIEELMAQIESLPDTPARELVFECLHLVLELYGDGLKRILQLTKNAGIEGQKICDALARDKFVSGLLLIHGLHPLTLEERLRSALDKIRPYLQSHGGNVELLSLDGDVARLRLQGTCKTCPSSSVTLELAVRQAIQEACPDLMGFEVEGVATSSEITAPHGPNVPHWTLIDRFEPLEIGKMRAIKVEGVPTMVCNSHGNLYAYRNRCAACDSALDKGTLTNGELCCPSGHRFDVRHAGICPDNSEIHLDPFPLLALNGTVKIAVKPESTNNQKTQSLEH